MYVMETVSMEQICYQIYNCTFSREHAALNVYLDAF